MRALLRNDSQNLNIQSDSTKKRPLPRPLYVGYFAWCSSHDAAIALFCFFSVLSVFSVFSVISELIFFFVVLGPQPAGSRRDSHS